MSIVVVAHDPNWSRKFELEAEVIRSALGPAISAIHHIGSTSIAGIHAKPVIDVLVEAASPEAVDRRAPFLVAKGYEAMGEFGLAGRRYFRKDNHEGTRQFQVHAFAAGSEEIARHLAFRDYLRSHPPVAEAYSQLKRRLAAKYPSDRDAYMDGKDPFIKATQRTALEWWLSAKAKG